MPGAAPPCLLDEVHASCKRAVAACDLLSLGARAIAGFAASLDPAAVRAALKPTLFPIQFDSREAEVTFLALFHLLDFGSGYEPELQAATQRGARETVQYGCFTLALSAKRLDSPWMRAFTPYGLHSAFGFDAKVEAQLQPGISISKPGPLAPLAAALQSAVVDAGNGLLAVGAKSLGALVCEHLDAAKAAGKPYLAAALVEELSDAIPGFQDAALFAASSSASSGSGAPPAQQGGAAGHGGDETGAFRLPFLRKAQALAADLMARFAADDERFRFADAAKLAADSGALLPAVLRALGLLRLSPALEAALSASGAQLEPGQQERALRAAAVAACDAVVEAAAAAAAAGGSGGGGEAPFTAAQLSAYLLGLVSEAPGGALSLQLPGGETAVVVPHRTRGTLAY